MTRRKKTPEVRRAEIIAAAKQLILDKGISNTSVGDITEAAEVGKGTFYLYFKSKEDVLFSLANEMGDKICENVNLIALSNELDALEKITCINDKLFDTNLNPELIEFYYHPDNVPLHYQLIKEITERVTPIIADVIKQGIEEGVFNVSDPKKAALLVVAASYPIQDYLTWKGESREKWKVTLSEFLLNGLGYKK